jgi:hypothetical protein
VSKQLIDLSLSRAEPNPTFSIIALSSSNQNSKLCMQMLILEQPEFISIKFFLSKEGKEIREAVDIHGESHHHFAHRKISTSLKLHQNVA